MRVLDPVPHGDIDWAQKTAPLNVKGEDWAAQTPEWWQLTQPARDAVAAEFDTDVAPSFPRGQVPFGDDPSPAVLSHVLERGTELSGDDELHVAVDVPEHVRLAISKWCDDVEWEGDHELEDPADYHVTVLYAPEGHTMDNHEWAESFNVTGYPFRVSGVDVFDSAEKPLDAIVLRLESPEFDRWATWFIERAKERGLEPSEFPGGYKAHVTVAYAENKPKGEPPRVAFRGGALYVSKPRAMSKAASYKGFPHWWDQKKPVTIHDAKILGEYARSEGLTKDALKKFLNQHEEDISGDDHERERVKDAIFTKYNRLSAFTSSAFVPKVFLDRTTGERRETRPEHRSLMQLLGEHYGLSTPELWDRDDLYEVPDPDLVESTP